jgi:hypothetical protein
MTLFVQKLGYFGAEVIVIEQGNHIRRIPGACFAAKLGDDLGEGFGKGIAAADIICGNRADHRKLFRLIQKMHGEGRTKFTQLIWEGDGRWIHISYVPSDLRSQVIE